MKRIASSAAVLTTLLALAACGPNEDNIDANPGKGNEGVGSADCGDQKN